MHHIQQSILTKLSKESPLTFSQIQPQDIPNNIFAYHLKKLVDTGYISHSGNKYSLTRKAMKNYLFDNHPSGERSNYPKSVTILYVTNSKGQVLLQKRSWIPFKDWYGLPSGLVHYGEKLEHAATRELSEKAGFNNHRTLSRSGVIDFRYYHQDSKDIFVHAIGYIFSYLKTTEVSLPKDCIWSDLKENNILPEVFSVRDIVNQDLPSIVSLDFEEPK